MSKATTVMLDAEHAKYLECIRSVDQITQSAALRASIKAHFHARMKDPAFAEVVAADWVSDRPGGVSVSADV